MVKGWVLKSALLTIALFSLVACNQGKSGSSTPANNQIYNSAYGYQAYPMDQYAQAYYSQHSQYGALSHLCGCPYGSRPVYNGSMGFGCAANAILPQTSSIYFHGLSTYQGSAYNGHYVNIPQVSNVSPSGSISSCYSNVAASCVIGQTGQCPLGTTCQSNGNNNSPIGICTRTP